MSDKKDELSEAELSNIVPFSGEEMTAAEKVMAQGGAMQRVQTAYTTAVAVQKSRSISRITKNVLEEAKLAGSSFFYRWEVTNKRTGRKSLIQGPSIDLAMCVARNYGNCALDIEVQETPTHFHFKGIFIDLETGFTVPRLYRQRKKQGIGGGYGDDRAEDIVFQIGQSKAQRNAIVKAAPAWLLDKAIEVARDAEIKNIKPEHIALARARVIEYFETHGIVQERIEAVLEKPADQWTAEDIVNLKGMATALKEGRETADELFPPVKEDQEIPEAETAETDKPKATGPVDEAGAKTLYEEAKNLRTPGYSTWVHENLSRIKEAPKQDQKKLQAKWIEHYEEPWPLDAKTETSGDSFSGVKALLANLKTPDDWVNLGLAKCPKMNDNNIPATNCQKCDIQLDSDGMMCPGLYDLRREKSSRSSH